MKRLGIRARVFLPTVAVIAGVLVLTGAVMRSLVDRILDAEIERHLSRGRRAYASFSAVRETMLLDQARSVAQVPHLRAVLDTPGVDESTVRYTMESIEGALDAELLFVSDASGTILGAAEGGAAADAALARALAGAETCSIGEHAGEPYLVAVCPVVLDGAVLGAVALGWPLAKHARDLRQVTGLDVTLVHEDRVLATVWAPSEDAAHAYAPPLRDPRPWTALAAGSDAWIAVDGLEHVATAIGLGEPELRLVLSRPLDAVLQQFVRARRELLVIGLVLGAIGLCAAHWIAIRIARPIVQLTSAANALARGDLASPVDVRAGGEVGLLASAFDHMARQLSELMRQTMEKARAAERASEAKSVFLATMSHEIRTPLHGVLGFVAELQTTSLSPEQREHLSYVQRSARDLLAILEDILDFARLESGARRLEQSELHLPTCIERALEPLRGIAESKRLQLDVRIDERLDRPLVGAPSRVRQIVAIYAENAVEFTPRGTVTVRAELVEETGRALVVRIGVDDTGPGIPRERIRQLFQPFVQLDAGARRSHGGAGLGLAICKELASLMHGEVGVESTPGAGSTFWFTASFAKARAVAPEEPVDAGASASTEAAAAPASAPATARAPTETHPDARSAAAAREPSIASPAPALPAAGSSSSAPPAWSSDAAAKERRARLRVLVAEDNPVNQRMVALVLRKAGFDHVIAENGLVALERFEKEAFDLVLMDCQMPELDGLEVTRRIRERERARGGDRRVPILALTANAFPSDREACLGAGMDDFVAKPFEAGDLVARIDRWLGCAGAA